MRMEVDANTLERIAQVIGDIFLVSTYNTFMHLFYKQAKNKWILIATYGSYLVAMIHLQNANVTPAVFVCTNLLFLYFITCNYRSKTRTRLMACIYLYAIMIMVETITVNLAKISGLDLTNLNDASISSMMSSIFSFFFVLLLKNMNLMQSGIELPRKISDTICFIPLSSIVVTFYMFATKSSTYLFMLILTSFLCALNLVVFHLYDGLLDKFTQTIKMKVVERQNRYYERQLAIMLESQENLRKSRHDSKNKLLVLQTMLINGESAKAIEYLERMSNELRIKEEIISTGNMAIDAIINYKLQKALEHHIHLNLDVSIPVELKIDSMDLAILLGNLLDNALLATQMLEEKREITIVMNYDKNLLYIHMMNPYLGKVKCLNGRYFTTKNDKQNHGIGLLSVAEIVERYHGLLEINHENQIFQVDVALYLAV